MTEKKLQPQPGTIWTCSGDGKKYQAIAWATDRESGKDMLIYQQLFEPFTVFAETKEHFFGEDLGEERHFEAAGNLAQRDKDANCSAVSRTMRETENVSQKPCETKNVSQKPRETKNVSQDARETKIVSQTAEEEPEIHPEFRRFLDAKSHSERIEILKGMRNIVDDTMINSMAVIMDMEIKDGPVAERFDELLECMQMKGQYEIERY